MEEPESQGDADELWTEGPLVLGVPWDFPEHLIRTASDLADGLGVHLVCAFVDPGSYLTEWEPRWSEGVSLEPAREEGGQFPSAQLLRRLEAVLGQPGGQWSFRVLNGAVAQALARLASSTGASLLVVGGPRPGNLARLERLVEGSVSVSLVRAQRRPVLVVPQRPRAQQTDISG